MRSIPKVGKRISSVHNYGTFDPEKKTIFENNNKGNRKSPIFKYAAHTGRMAIPITGMFFLFQIVQSSTDFVLRLWTSGISGSGERSDWSYCIIYTVMVLLDVVIGLALYLFFYHSCTVAGDNLHRKATQSLLQTKVSFFSCNTAGSIFNRFSMDMGLLDENLPTTLQVSVVSTLQIVGIAALIVVLNNTLFFFIVLSGLALFLLRKLYGQPSADLRRIEANERSPVYTHINNTLEGLTIIRTLGQQKTFTEYFWLLKDTHIAANYAYQAAFSWLMFCIDVLVWLFCAAAVGAFLLFPTDTSAAGMALSLILSVGYICMYGMRKTAELENQLVSIDRLSEYVDLEPETELKGGKLNLSSWSPRHGTIQFKGVYASYLKGISVLKNISFSILEGEKVAVMGRTGAGKSSLIGCILRIVDITNGSIEIGGTDIQRISIRDLRSNISVITQHPALIEGTLRDNLDVHAEYTDLELHKVLTEVQLRMRSPEGGALLQVKVETGGKNFSHGERQLISLARAILRKNKILLLDEATANVDPETDQIVQEVIKTKFHNSTVISIAHNLNSVLHSDRICVIHGGRIVEFDSPRVLLTNRESALSRLVQWDDSKLNGRAN